MSDPFWESNRYLKPEARPILRFRAGWWYAHYKHVQYGIVHGRGRKVKSAWNDLQRRLKWHAKGAPGMPIYTRQRLGLR